MALFDILTHTNPPALPHRSPDRLTIAPFVSATTTITPSALWRCDPTSLRNHAEDKPPVSTLSLLPLSIGHSFAGLESHGKDKRLVSQSRKSLSPWWAVFKKPMFFKVWAN